MAIVRRLKIVQRNVRHWSTTKIGQLLRTPILSLSTVMAAQQKNKIKIFDYTIHQRNSSQKPSDGVAIAMKRSLNYILLEYFQAEILAIKLTTTMGEVIIATVYLPPRRNFLPNPDILKLTNYNCPVYKLGDVNARHQVFGNNNSNQVGTSLDAIIQTGKLIHLGPNFPFFYRTYITHPTRQNLH